MRCVIVIPVYKENPDKDEFVSLIQCLRILNNYDICLIVPNNLNISNYSSIFIRYNIRLNVKYFDPFYFKGISGYNRLMLSRDFYCSFEFYDYMLIYQLDAYVFRDDLMYWCKKNYDYIGAPWLYSDGSFNKKISGNGGLSLRRIRSFIDLFNMSGKLFSYEGLFSYLENRGFIHRFFYYVRILLFGGNTLDYLISINEQNEDRFYASLKYKLLNPFKVPDYKESMFFSFECSPNLLFKETLEELPFGCHAWRKNFSFWEKYIKVD
ncbi:MAG: hypothetical protein IJ430_04200 [Parabacteroides sp.]|nr:hypothetical protein [Parabacteroides sp.]